MKVAPIDGLRALLKNNFMSFRMSLRTSIITAIATVMMLFCGYASAVSVGQACSPDGSTGISEAAIPVTCVQGVWAATSTVTAPDATLSTDAVKRMSRTMIDNTQALLFDKAKHMGLHLKDEVTVFFWLMSAILVAYAGLKMIAGDKMDELIEAAITVSFFSLLFFEYETIFVDNLSTFFKTWMDYLVAEVSLTTNGVSPGSSVSDIAGLMASNVASICLNILTTIKSAFMDISLANLFANIAALVFLWFLTGPMIQQIMTVAAGYVAMFVISDAIASVAIILGPVFIAFGVLDYTRTMFRGWVGLLVAAFGVKVVAVAVLPILTMVTSYLVADEQDELAIGAHSSLDDVFAIMVIIAVAGELVGLIPMIAKTLFDGVAGYGSGSTSRIGSMISSAQQSSSKAGTSGTKDLGTKMWNAFKR